MDAGDGFRIADVSGEALVEDGEVVELGAALGAADAGGIVQVEHGIRPGAEDDALMLGRQEAGAPQAGENRLIRIFSRALGNEDHVGGQVGVIGAETVADPGAGRGVAELHRAGVDQGDGGIVVDRLGVHRADDTDFPGDLLGVGKQVGNPNARRAAGFSGGDRLDHGKRGLARGHAGDALAATDGIREIGAVELGQDILAVE